MLSGVHILLTYKCTRECDHCFLNCSPWCEGTFTLRQLRDLLREVAKIPSVNTVYFEGGEAFLFYPLLLQGLRLARAAGLQSGIVTNGYWATSVEDAEQWLLPMLDVGIVDFSVSDDEFHSSKGGDSPGAIAYRAARKLGLPCARIRIRKPGSTSASAMPGRKGQPVPGRAVLFKGRAAEKLTSGLPLRPWQELKTCPHEELAAPDRVHVDAYGNVHICQGISIGNMWSTPFSKLLRDYRPGQHPIVGPLLGGGPAQLVRQFDITVDKAYVDECHLCYVARKLLLPKHPGSLAPPEVYGIQPIPAPIPPEKPAAL